MTAALRILAIDDEPPIRKLLRMGLSSRADEAGKVEPDPERPHYILTETGIARRLRDPALVATPRQVRDPATTYAVLTGDR